MSPKLTPKQRQYLKAEAHHLKPAVHIGKGGITPGLLAEMDLMVESLELMKVKLNGNTMEDEEAVVQAFTSGIEGLQHVWTIGHTLLFFRQSRNKPSKYTLPSKSGSARD